MKRPIEIPEDLWEVLTVGVAGAAHLLPPSFETCYIAQDLCSVAFEDDSANARMLCLRCQDEGGKYSKGMGISVEKSIAKARKLLKRPDKSGGVNLVEYTNAVRDAFESIADAQKLLSKFVVQPSPTPIPKEPARREQLAEMPLRSDICSTKTALWPMYWMPVTDGSSDFAIVQHLPVTHEHGKTCLAVTIRGPNQIRFTMPIDEPGSVRASGRTGALRTEMAIRVLTFELAVRRGVPEAVAAYGLIQAALVLATRERAEAVRTVVDAADDAFAELHKAVQRSLDEGEGR